MRNLATVFFCVLAFAATHLAAAQNIRRVNNSGAGVSGVNVYTTLQAAHDAASSGDLIYLEPTNISYGNLTCIRPLTIIGNGYFLQQNTGLQADTRESVVGTITFSSGSGGSRLTGCTVSGNVYLMASNLTVERNQLTGTATYLGYNGSGTYASVSNLLVRQNYFNGTDLYIYPGTNTTVGNVNITNNLLIGADISSSVNYTNLNNLLISGNVVGSLNGSTANGIQVDNAVIKNNILTYTGTGAVFTSRNNAYSYNIAGNTAFGTANGNQQNVPPATLFVGGTASADGAFRLRSGSPAVGTGESGTDVGAYGGALPYRLSGIPNVPTIYQYSQSVSGNSLNATLSTRSNN